ncbi:MAG: septum formation initiator family protein [Candidatus Omnitrophota bacterium]
MIKNAFWLFLFATVILFVFLPSYTKMQDLQQKNVEYKREIDLLQKKRDHLIREKKLLESDPVYLEKVAREKMGLVREGEVIYRLLPEEEKK